MSAGNVVVVVIGIAAVIGFIAFLLLRRNDPESAATHERPPRTGSALHHGGVHDRPAGPGAEADGVAGPGEPTPGPSAETGPERDI